MHSLSFPRTGRKAITAGAVAVLAAFATAAPSIAAPTAVESVPPVVETDATSLDSSFSWGRTSLNFAAPSDSTEFHFTRTGD